MRGPALTHFRHARTCSGHPLYNMDTRDKPAYDGRGYGALPHEPYPALTPTRPQLTVEPAAIIAVQEIDRRIDCLRRKISESKINRYAGN